MRLSQQLALRARMGLARDGELRKKGAMGMGEYALHTLSSLLRYCEHRAWYIWISAYGSHHWNLSDGMFCTESEMNSEARDRIVRMANVAVGYHQSVNGDWQLRIYDYAVHNTSG